MTPLSRIRTYNTLRWTDSGVYWMCWTRRDRRSSAPCVSSTCAKATGSCSCTRSPTSRATKTCATSTHRSSASRTASRTRCCWPPTRWTWCTRASWARSRAAGWRARWAAPTSRPAPRSRRYTWTAPSTSWCASSGTTRNRKRSTAAGAARSAAASCCETRARTRTRTHAHGRTHTRTRTDSFSHKIRYTHKTVMKLHVLLVINRRELKHRHLKNISQHSSMYYNKKHMSTHVRT